MGYKSMILISGGTGYIGSHACVEFLKDGEELLVLDNLSNSNKSVISRVKSICGRGPLFVDGDIRDAELLQKLFQKYPIKSVIHFAGLKAVGESVANPLRYYDNNVSGSLNLLKAMATHNVKTIVFSSSATVYGEPENLPITENSRLGPVNPYGQTKLMIEKILLDLALSDPVWRIAILRYFNPVGAHESGLIGEAPKGTPNNLMPYIGRVATGQAKNLAVFGNDYPTPDGTGIRDYIHVVDLVRGHIKALEYLSKNKGAEVFNLGTGRGYSVLEMIAAFQQASGRNIPWRIHPRRSGDVASSYADAEKAERLLGWKAEKNLESMCRDSWRWIASKSN